MVVSHLLFAARFLSPMRVAYMLQASTLSEAPHWAEEIPKHTKRKRDEQHLPLCI